MPAKKQKRPKKPKTVPVPVVSVPVAVPVLPPEQRRFWKIVQTKNLIGGTMFLLGIGFCAGFFFSDRAHGFEKWVLGAGLLLMLLGAHFLSSEPTERALSALARTAGKVIPLARKDSDGTKEQPTPPPPSGQ